MRKLPPPPLNARKNKIYGLNNKFSFLKFKLKDIFLKSLKSQEDSPKEGQKSVLNTLTLQ